MEKYFNVFIFITFVLIEIKLKTTNAIDLNDLAFSP